MNVVLLLLCAILPLAMAPALLFHYDVSPKTVALSIAAAIALWRLASAPEELSALWSRRAGRALVISAGLQILWIAITTATSTRPWFSLFGSGWRQFGAMTIVPMLLVTVLVAAYLCQNPECIGTMLKIAVSAGIAASLYGIAQYFDVDPLQPASIYHAHAGDAVITRPPGTLGHADYFAWWLAITFFCGVAVARTGQSRWQAAGIACAIVTAAATLLSGTRSAILAILAGAIVCAFLTRLRIGRKAVLAAAALLAVSVVFCFSPAGARLRARAAWSGDEPAGGARLWLWRDSARMSAAKPVFGFGPETFQAAFGVWESEELARQFPDFHHESPHNLALDALTAEGVPGLLLIFAWVGVAWATGKKALRARSGIAPPLVAGLVASAVAAIFNAASLGPVLLTLLVLAALVALDAPVFPSAPRRNLRPVFAVAGGLLGVALVVFAATLTAADFRLVRFQRQPDAGTYQAFRNTRLPGAAEDIFCSRTLLNQCRSLTGIPARLECWRAAEQVAARAVETADDTANAWYNLALFTAAQNDVRGTKMALGRAIGVAPVWFKPHWGLAKLLAQTGEPKAAAAEASRAAVLNGNHDSVVTETSTSLPPR